MSYAVYVAIKRPEAKKTQDTTLKKKKKKDLLRGDFVHTVKNRGS